MSSSKDFPTFELASTVAATEAHSEPALVLQRFLRAQPERSGQENRPCDRCREFRVKCSRTVPCTRCSRAKVDCKHDIPVMRSGRITLQEMAAFSKAGIPYVTFRQRRRAKKVGDTADTSADGTNTFPQDDTEAHSNTPRSEAGPIRSQPSAFEPSSQPKQSRSTNTDKKQPQSQLTASRGTKSKARRGKPDEDSEGRDEKPEMWTPREPMLCTMSEYHDSSASSSATSLASNWSAASASAAESNRVVRQWDVQTQLTAASAIQSDETGPKFQPKHPEPSSMIHSLHISEAATATSGASRVLHGPSEYEDIANPAPQAASSMMSKLIQSTQDVADQLALQVPELFRRNPCKQEQLVALKTHRFGHLYDPAPFCPGFHTPYDVKTAPLKMGGSVCKMVPKRPHVLLLDRNG